MSGIQELYRLDDVTAGSPSVLMLFPIGDWTSQKYPSLSLTQELADAVIANFTSDVLRRKVPVESVGTHDGSSPAGGWIDRLYMAPFEWGGVKGEALYADWTPNERGAQIVNDGQYLYDSVELGSHIDPVTGEKTDNVLKAVALTNRPVLSLMPSVKDAGESMRLAEPVVVALSEVSLAATKTEDGVSFPAAAYAYVPDPETPSTWKLRLWATPSGGPDARIVGAAVAALGKGFRGQKVEIPVADLPAVKAKVRAAWKKANPDRDDSEMPEVIRASEDHPPDSDLETPTPADSAAVAPGKAAEGAPLHLADEASPKGAERTMKSVIAALKLAENASEADVLASVTRLAEHDAAETSRADAAELKLSEREQADKVREIEAKLAEATTPDEAGRLRMLPAEKDAYLKMAETSHEAALAAIEARLSGPAMLKLGEVGSGTEGEGESRYADPSVELAETAKARARKDGSTYADAEKIVLAEDKDLAARYREFRFTGKEA